MKVEGPNRSQQTDQTRKKDKASAGDGSFGRLVAGDEAQEASGAGASQSIASIDTLLAVQGADDPAQRAARKRMRRRADTLLAELDRIKMGLLNGTLTVGHVIDIADVVASHREKIMDPQLTAILDEIDLRAQIELAKMRLTLDKAV
jgi:hypothetical protein